MLLGRGYFQVCNGDVLEDDFPQLKELPWEEDQDNDELDEDDELEDDDEFEEDDEYCEENEKITCKKVKKYLSVLSTSHRLECSNYWIKGLPAEPEDVGNKEGYMLVCIGSNDTDNSDIEIVEVVVISRIVQQFGFGLLSIPGVATMESRFFEMESIPPEVIKEIETLISGRFIPKGFTLIGKKMPDNKEIFHPNPPYSLANNSGWRNVYWHLSITVDNDIIKDFELATYEREISMFQRPFPMANDLADAFDAALMIVDQYTDEEWKEQIIKDIPTHTNDTP